MLSNFVPLTFLLPAFQLFSLSFATDQHMLKEGRPSPLNSKFAELVKEELELWHVPGISIAVVDGDDTWAEGYGFAKFPDTPITPSTLFYGASTTKAFTSFALSLLITSNSTKYSYLNLNWDTPISSIIYKDFVLSDPYLTTHVTIEDALTHRTGMPRHDLSYGGVDETGEKSDPRDVTRSLRFLPTTAGLREKFQYCNLMYTALGYVLEALTGKWLEDFLREEIWVPLGMNSTYFSTPDALKAPEPLAEGYVYNNSEYVSVPYMDTTVVSGAGSIISNVIDYSKWIRAFLFSSSPFPPATYTELLKPRTLVLDYPSPKYPYTGPQAYALGWFNGVYKGYEYFTHSGGLEAFGTQVIFLRELGFGIVIFGNTGVTSNIVEEKLMWWLIDEKIGVKEKERFDWDELNKKIINDKEKSWNSSLSTFYPYIPSPRLAPYLPLSTYTGTYMHPAYHNLTITLPPSSSPQPPLGLPLPPSSPFLLHISRNNVLWKMDIDLKHVSGEYWMADMDSSVAPGLVMRQVVPAEFVVGVEGRADRFGIAIEEEMGREGRVWFDRI